MSRAWKRVLVALSLAAALCGPARAASHLTERQAELVQKAEAALDGIRTLKSRFMQATSQGEVSQGTVYLSRPGRLRIEYDPPTPLLVVANGAYFTFVDTQLKQLSYLDLDATPAGILLREKISFADKDIRIRQVTEKNGIAEIRMTSTKDTSAGSLTLIFTLAPFELRQWRVIDAQGLVTDVTLEEPQIGVALKKSLFDTPQAPAQP